MKKNAQEIKNLVEIIRPELNTTPLPTQLLHTLEAPMSDQEFRDIFKQTIEFMEFSVG